MDGRKSFRQISLETGITTPTVKARFERLVNVDFIKGVLPIFDFGKVYNTNQIIQIQNITKNDTKEREDFDKNYKKIIGEADRLEEKMTNGFAIHLVCDYCHGAVFGKSRVLKFADLERFFVVTLVGQIIMKNIREG